MLTHIAIDKLPKVVAAALFTPFRTTLMQHQHHNGAAFSFHKDPRWT
jgi:hypothetical protein